MKILLIYFLFVMACSTAKVRVMPKENGMNTVVVRDIERDNAEEEALEAANEYCEKQNKRPIFKDDKTKYTGEMKEETRKTVRNASKAAMIVGGVGGLATGRHGLGGIVGTAGTVGYAMTSNRDYATEMNFRCE